MPMKVISGTANMPLAKRIAEHLDVPLADVVITRFPDQETFIKISENIRGHDVFLIQPSSPPANENLMELLIMIDAIKRASAMRITAVMPYFGYARQDRKDQPRVPITAKLVANLITSAGADRMLMLDLHSQQLQGFFDIPVDHLYASPVIVKYIRSKQLDNMVVVSPDVGGVKMAYAYAKMLDAGVAIVNKQRTSATEVEVLNLVGDVQGRDVVMVDDLTSTAGTLTQAARLLKKSGAKRIFAAVSHCLLTDLGVQRLNDSPIEELIATDSIVPPVSTSPKLVHLSVAELLGDAILRIHNNQSVTSLFRI
jgi:ribose-phosphate pyrophosphokinase